MAEITQKLGFDAQGAISTLDKLTDALGKANTALATMSTSASGAKALDKVEKGTKKATKAADDFTVSWKTIIRVLQTQIIVRGLNTLITGLKDSIENARELGLAIEEVRTIDVLGRSAEEISKAVLRLSDAIGQAPTDLAEGFYQTLSNQVVGAADAFQFMAEAAKLAKVTASETGDAVNALSSVMNSYSLASSEAEHVAGTLFATVEQGRLRLSEIANVIGRVTPLTAQLGITWEETAASIATMTRQGVRADTAITQLRAVVTRLLKPTAEMSAIFRKWGVEDGRQAILTFGGLSGVLKKLAEETGHNSGEMAELLRNVRAVAGVFGIMNNEGKTLEEVLGHVETATKKATKAWEEYTKSDAQKLTVEMQKFDNQLTRVGVHSLPLVTKALKAINFFIEAQGAGIKVLSGDWGSVEQAAHRYEQAVIKGANEGLELQRDLADAGRGQYDVLTSAMRLHYAEANKLENQLADTRDRGIKRATTVFETAANNLSNLYKDTLTEIEKFADGAAGRVEKTLNRIAGIERGIEDRKLAYRLRQAKSTNEKLAVLGKALRAAEQNQDEAAAKISASPKSEEAFIKASEQRTKIAEQRYEVAKRENASAEVQHGLFLDLIQADKDHASGLERAAGLTQGLADLAGGIKEEYGGIDDRMKEINDRQVEIREDGVINPSEKVEMAELTAEAERLTEKLKEATKALDPLGLDVDFNTLVDGMTEAMNQAHKDWAEEVKRLKAEFSKEVFPIKVSLDPSGVRAEFQKLTGQEQIPGESQAAFAGRGDEAALVLLNKQEDVENKIKVARKSANAPLKETSSLLGEIGQKTSTTAREIAQQHKTRNAAQLAMGKSQTVVMTEAVLLARQQTEEAVKLQGAYREQVDTALEGGVLDQQRLNDLRAEVLEAFKNKQITSEQLGLYAELDGQLTKRIGLQDELVKLTEQLAPEEQVKAAERVLEVAKETEAATKLDAKQQEAIKKAKAEQVIKQEEVKTATEGTANAAEGTANATSDAATEAGTLSIKAGLATIALGFAAIASNSIAASLERAQKAAEAIANTSISPGSGSGSGSGAGATAYHGGTHYADGGMVRGPDRQLTALARGETVVNRKQSRKFFSELNAMNQGSQPVYRDQGGPVTNVGDVNVTVRGGDSSQQTVREIGHALRREVKRGNILLR